MSPKVDHRLSPNLKETGTMRSKWVTEGRVALRTHSLVKLNFALRTTWDKGNSRSQCPGTPLFISEVTSTYS